MARSTRLMLQVIAGAIHLLFVGGAFAAVSAVLWILLMWCGRYCGCPYQPSFFEAAGMLAFGYIVVRSSAFARMQGMRMRRATFAHLWGAAGRRHWRPSASSLSDNRVCEHHERSGINENV
ncbi:MAG: hypothetical protein KatS3mg039_0359 [Candidatus Kapaibacterium sp.]|nr:MAG: hypothetical protein KatS3mg039_0359 [Candidatus Kapabacteria bacterium]